MKRTVEDYMALPYTIQIIKNADGTFFASIKELPGCMTEGDSLEEVYQMIEDAKQAWLSTALDDGMAIPIPDIVNNRTYSGKLVVRFPRELHRSLAQNAEINGVSLNAYINMLLAERNAQNSRLKSNEM